SIDDCFHRVAKEFASDEEEEKNVFQMLKENVFRPNSPVFFNAGTEHKRFSACYVSGLEDSMHGIYDVANLARKIFQYGAGIGIPIGNLREKDANIYAGDKNSVPVGRSSGPISFMKLYDAVGETTKSGGRSRRAAILMAMNVWHPDIVSFIQCKETDGQLKNMNISVSITDEFMQAFKDNVPFKLRTPCYGEVIDEINARKLWDYLIDSAHKSADPGVLFIDTINKFNLLKKRYLIEASNPCLTGDTLIITNKGKRSILDLLNNKENDDIKILSYDTETESIEFQDLANVFLTKKNSEIIELQIEENENIYKIKCTPDHKIYTKNRGFVEAGKLTSDDDIYVL
ncbi:MAG: ribonucleotide reductase N-terminal alpha domain-containing protein, partial [Methanogenium sp.]